MQSRIIKPSIELSSVVKQYLVITDLQTFETMYCLPNGGNFLVFNRGLKACSKLHTDDIYEIPQGLSASIKTDKAKKIVIDKDFSLDSITLPIILVELTPIGFYKLFLKDASTLNQAYVTIDSEIQEKYFNDIYLQNDITEMIDYLDKSLINLKNDNSVEPLLIEQIIQSIVQNHSCEVTVEELAIEFHITRRTMERQFKKTVGYTPKNFIFILKFCKTFLKYMEEVKSLNDIEYLYTDNAHFNVVFKKITGYTPRQLFKIVQNNEIKIYQMQKNIKLF